MLLNAPLLVPSDDAARGTKPRDITPGHAHCCRCTMNWGQREAAAAPEERTWLAYDGPDLQRPWGALVLLCAPLFEPSDAAARGR